MKTKTEEIAKRRTITIRLDETTLEAVEALAELGYRSVSAQIAMMLATAIKTEKK